MFRGTRIDERVIDAGNNGRCRVQTAVSQILGYERAVAHFASSITRGEFHGNFFVKGTIDSQTAVMDGGAMGQVAQEPACFKIVDPACTYYRVGMETL